MSFIFMGSRGESRRRTQRQAQARYRSGPARRRVKALRAARLFGRLGATTLATFALARHPFSLWPPMDTLQAQRAVIRTRIDAVRNALTRHQLAALVAPSSDPHLSECLPERWQGRQWLSGFTGSVGTLVG